LTALRLAAENAELDQAPTKSALDLRRPSYDDTALNKIREHQDYHRATVGAFKDNIAKTKRHRKDTQVRLKKARSAAKMLYEETIAAAKARYDADLAELQLQEDDAIKLEQASLDHDQLILRSSEAALKVLEDGAE
jgi:hypothetical protein